jgi:uncharacterized protein YeaO (DUF488 family)
MIKLQRAYDAPMLDGSRRFLVDRVWPRGRKREDLRLEAWLKDVGPSNALRAWFGHDPARWQEFRRRYRAELAGRPESLVPLLEAARAGAVTLVYGAKDTEHNQAQVLKEFLEERLG